MCFILQSFVQKHLHQVNWLTDHVYFLLISINSDTQTSDIKLDDQALNIYKNINTCEKNNALKSKWNTYVHLKLLDLIIKSYKDTVSSLNMYVFKPSSFSQLTCIQNEYSDFISKLVNFSHNWH